MITQSSRLNNSPVLLEAMEIIFSCAEHTLDASTLFFSSIGAEGYLPGKRSPIISKTSLPTTYVLAGKIDILSRHLKNQCQI